MEVIIDGFDFFQMEAQKYYSTPNSWDAEKKKQNAMNKIFSLDWCGSRKVDGVFGMIGRNLDGEIFWRPRAKNTKGEFVNKVDWIPQIHDFLNEIDPGTVFLCETYIPAHESAKDTTSVLNCLLPKSLKRQENEEYKLHIYIFDVLAENGKSYLNWKASDRFDLLNSFARAYSYNYVEWAQYYDGKELWDMLQHLLANGYEGMVITKKDAPYTPGSRKSSYTLKIKKEIQETIDCVIIGANSPTKLSGTSMPEEWEWWFNETTNEKILASEYFAQHHESIYKSYVEGAPVVPVTKAWFYGWAGSLKLGLYDEDKLIYVGDLSGIDESVKEHWKDYVNSVAEISCMEITENQNGGWGFRHPRLLSWRKDKPARECTISQIRQKGLIMMFSIVVAVVFVIGGLICYASCYVASNADHISEEYWQRKIADQQLENLKNRKNDDII